MGSRPVSWFLNISNKATSVCTSSPLRDEKILVKVRRIPTKNKTLRMKDLNTLMIKEYHKINWLQIFKKTSKPQSMQQELLFLHCVSNYFSHRCHLKLDSFLHYVVFFFNEKWRWKFNNFVFRYGVVYTLLHQSFQVHWKSTQEIFVHKKN